ncbi:MAG: hypothetical protein QOJ13_716 [Gaiellales bacterium]|jgi:EmrB/QacA subfamily drug resistance transporter|nr:hypothetical protein [Gaiellales bacterium]
MSTVDTTLVNVAFETLARTFGASITSIQWVSTGYLLGLVATIPLAAWASDRFGAKRVWIASVSLFLVGSILAGAAPSLGSLIAFRILQGLGGGMIIPVGMTVMTRAAGPHRMGRVMSILGLQQLLGPVLGPLLGGMLVQHASWRWIFFVNVPIGVVAILLAMRVLPRCSTRRGMRFDGVGILLVSPGMAAIIYGLTETERAGALGPEALVPLLAGIGLVATFLVRARRGTTLVDLGLFRVRTFAAGAATSFFLGTGLFAVLFVLPLYYQGARGASPVDAGVLLIPQGIGTAIAMPFAGRVSDRAGPGLVVLSGLALMIAGTVPFALAAESMTYPMLTAALVVRGVGMGLATMPAMAGAYASLGKDRMAEAASLLTILRRLGGSLGVALVAVVLEHALPGSAGAVGGRGAPPAVMAEAFSQTFWLVVGFCALAVVPALLLPRRPPPPAAKRPRPPREPMHHLSADALARSPRQPA